MFPIPFNFPFRKKDGSMSTIGDEISAGGGGGGYTLPTASAETKGGIKIGSGLAMEGEVLNNSNPTPYSLSMASAETLGGVKVGDGLAIDENGVLSASGGGGGNKYGHSIIITASNSIIISALVVNDSNTPLNTVEALAGWLTDKGFINDTTTWVATLYPSTGMKGTTASNMIYGIYAGTSTSLNAKTLSSSESLSGVTIVDTVFTI